MKEMRGLKANEVQAVLQMHSVEAIHAFIKERLELAPIKKSRKKAKRGVTKTKQAVLKKRAEKFRSVLVNKQTPAEQAFKSILKSLKVKYKFQEIFYVGPTFRIVDFYIPDAKVVYEIDGGYHNTPEQINKDLFRTKMLLKHPDIKSIHRLNNSDALSPTQAESLIRFTLKPFMTVKPSNS